MLWKLKLALDNYLVESLAIMWLFVLESARPTGGSALLNSKIPTDDNAAATTHLENPMYDVHRIVKRMEMDLETCLAQFDVHKNTIIRTGESQAIGGKYLQGLELSNSLECQRLCCETETCDVFVFEDKNEGYCYLFKCGPPENFHCKFTRHASYTSAVLTSVRQVVQATTPHPRLPHIGTTNISQQEQELTNLKVKPELQEEKVDVAATVTAAANVGVGVGSSAPANPAPMPAFQMAAAEKDVTQKAYNDSAHCGRFQFMCHSGECIAVYNACDGIPQCEDGSDEGPECSGAAGNVVVFADKPSPKPITELPPYRPVLMQQQTSQQQLQALQQNHVPLLHTSLINNREDAAAWANRKPIQAMQIQTENTGTLAIPIKGDLIRSNMNTDAMQANNVIYVPITQDNQQNQQNHLWQYQQQHPQQQSQPQPRIDLMQPVVELQQQQQQQHNAYMTNNVQGVAPQILMPQPPAAAATNAPLPGNLTPATPNLIVNSNSRMNEAMAPNQLHANTSNTSLVVTHKEPIISTATPRLPQNANSELKPAAEDHKQQQPQVQHVAPVHEQYKIIHANLAMEFHSHDHDGHSERPNGAVLSLTLGLLITAALAILIGCRMRTVGRPTRRLGKAPYAHDADFLVNGMYL